MKLDSEFIRLPFQFDADRLAAEAAQFAESEWRKHPQGHAGNTAVPLIAAYGDPANDAVKGSMRPTPEMARCPYITQILAALGAVWGRTRLMRIQGNGEAHAHVDVNYYWLQRVRVHVPVQTYPEVEFLCGDRALNMAAGECWLFDTWRMHNVLNHNDKPRIHLVADTVGSAEFADFVELGHRPFDPISVAGPPKFIPYGPAHDGEIAFESANFPIVMTPWEQECLLAGVLEELGRPTDATTAAFATMLRRFHATWRALWARFADGPVGDDLYRRALTTLDENLTGFAGRLALPNGVDAAEAVRHAIVLSALNFDLRAEAPVSAASEPTSIAKMRIFSPEPDVPDEPGPSLALVHQPTGRPSRLIRPLFILAAPRSGSSLLFETLARSPDVFTVGGESHEVVESIRGLHPRDRGWDSNRLSAVDADPDAVAELRTRFLARLHDRDGAKAAPVQSDVRMLEKTPKNALRAPFLLAAFPDARFIYLYRDPRENVSSILDAWRSGRFAVYPELPGWSGLPWSLLLVPGWRELVGRPLAEIAAAQWAAAHRTMLDDLSAVDRDRWTTTTYADFLTDPRKEVERLCTFAEIGWDQELDRLPLSRHTLTPPAADKWKKNAADLEPVLPALAEITQRFAALQAAPARRVISAPAFPIAATPSEDELKSLHTSNLPRLLSELGASLLVSTYQAGKLVILRADGDVLNTHFRAFPSPMGIARDGNRLALGALHQVWEFQDQPEVGRKLEPAGRHDACFLPRQQRYTGDVRIHEIAFADGELWIVNTRFSCLCTLDDRFSFVPRWRPSFVTALAPEDRCHLNGLAVKDGRPHFVTALGVTDSVGGWRADKRYGGVLIDLPSEEVVVRGLSMPHSPRWHDGKLWILESGRGTLGIVDLASGKVETVVRLPGFTRGLDFCGPYAFIGLSQVRESATFSGLPITERAEERQCGVQVVDLRSGRAAAFLRFTAGVEEIFAVQCLAGISWPDVVHDDEEILKSSFILPAAALADVPANRRAG